MYTLKKTVPDMPVQEKKYSTLSVYNSHSKLCAGLYFKENISNVYSKNPQRNKTKINKQKNPFDNIFSKDLQEISQGAKDGSGLI